MLASSLLLGFAPFAFKGGDANALVHEVALARKVPVCLLATPQKVYPAFTIGSQAPEDFRRVLNLRAGLATNTKTGLGLSPKAWPVEAYFLAERPRYVQSVAPKSPKFSRSGDRLTLVTPDAPIDVDGLRELRWSKPLRTHWFYRDLAVWVEARAASEFELLRTIAESVGATFHEDPKGYSFEYDPKSYRNRGVETLGETARNVGPEVASRAKFTQEALRHLDDVSLRNLFEPSREAAIRKPDPKVPVDTPLLKRLAYDRLAITFGLVDGKSTKPGLQAVWEHHRKYVDWTLPPLVGLSQSGWYDAILRGTDLDGKPFQVLL